MKKPTVFLDRDGTIIVEVGYISNPDDLELIGNAGEAIKKLNDSGILTIVVSNQAGVARGYFKEDNVTILNQKLVNVLKEKKAYLDGIYYCPHHKKGIVEEYAIDCECRKPKAGLIHQALNDFKDIDLDKSYVVGDKATDIEMAINAGCKGVLLKTGYGSQVLDGTYQNAVKTDYIAENIEDAINWILEDLKQ